MKSQFFRGNLVLSYPEWQGRKRRAERVADEHEARAKSREDLPLFPFQFRPQYVLDCGIESENKAMS